MSCDSQQDVAILKRMIAHCLWFLPQNPLCLPFSRLAGRVFSSARQSGGKHVGEGSLLGGIGNLLDGDN